MEVSIYTLGKGYLVLMTEAQATVWNKGEMSLAEMEGITLLFYDGAKQEDGGRIWIQHDLGKLLRAFLDDCARLAAELIVQDVRPAAMGIDSTGALCGEEVEPPNRGE